MQRASESPDVLVVGAGIAGLSAALEAAEQGASVLVLEKMAVAGGNTSISDGGIAVPGTPQQQSAGIQDSSSLMSRDMLSAGMGLNDPDLVRTITEGAFDAYRWSVDHLGIDFLDRVDLFGGHSVPRGLTPVKHTGAVFIEHLLGKLKDTRTEVRLNTSVMELVSDKSGRITGLRAQTDFHFGRDNANLVEKSFECKALVVASGGFSADVPFRQAQDPRLGSSMKTTNKKSATAEVLKACMQIGANPVHLSRIQLGPWTSPDEEGYGAGPLFGDYVVLPYGLLVDPQPVSRFVNELADRGRLADAILSCGHPVIGITDAGAVERTGWDLGKALKKGVVKRFDSLELLGHEYEMNPTLLQSVISRFNLQIKEGKDSDYNKIFPAGMVPLETAPFYAMRFWPKVHHTMGGIQINQDACVIHRDQFPIPGLYAAGEVTGGIHGASRLGSCALTEGLVMGRIAGRNAAQFAHRQGM